MSSSLRRNQFPDFFTLKGPIPTKITPLQFGNKICYQSSVITSDTEMNFISKPQLKPYLDNDDEMVNCEEIEDNYDIILTKSGKFQTSFYVPSSLLSFIIGAKGSKLKALQKNTNTIIKIPRINETGDIIIQGDTERRVASARTQIAIIVADRKNRLRFTHFVGIPVNSKIINDNFNKFQEKVLEDPARGISKSIFQSPPKLHLTIEVLTLLDKEEITLAKKSLEICYNEYISKLFPSNFNRKVTVKGLDIMNDDPSNVYVLYANVQMQSQELTEKLQQICNHISNYFARVGLAKKKYDTVKLHMTIMNVNYRESGEEKAPFDARTIIEKYGNFYFGEFELQYFDLCIRGTSVSDTGEAKYYETALRISL
ncbi:hypothetical protein ABEB36_009178 [Hypothenemus hampei]|uniref:K Homology domain-containing protein n=1 Tax=Hypothenemus hampei TaxID=57062 RepID=A0ABD1EPE2_HYPHA